VAKEKQKNPYVRQSMSVALSRKEIDAIRLMADRAKLSVSDFIRRCIDMAGHRISGIEHEPLAYRGPREEVKSELESEWELL